MTEKKEKVSGQQKEITYFKYRAQTSRYAFPLDYSIEQFAKKVGVNTRTVKKYLTGNPLFARFFQHMRYDGKYTKQGPEKHKVFNGIPAELEKFFAEFWMYAYKHKKRQAFKSRNLPQDLEKEFCKKLHEQALIAERDGDQNNLYLYRRLYKNAVFQETLLEEYWDKFQMRCKLLANLIRRLDCDAQMERLRGLIGMLDMEIAVQASRAARMQQGKRTIGSFLGTFPSEVLDDLRGRRIIRSHIQDETAKFNLPNLTVDHPSLEKKTLQEAFDEIVGSKNGASKSVDEARRVYMDYIRGLNEKTLFQKQCEALQEYLNDFRKPLDKVKEEIQAVSIKLYGSIVRGEPIATGVHYDGFARKRDQGEKQRFIVDEVNYMYSQFAYECQNFLGYLRPTDVDGDELGMMLKLASLATQSDKRQGELYALCDERIKAHLDTVELFWVSEYLGAFRLVKDDFENKYEGIAEQMAKICGNAFDFFGVEIPYWADCAHIKKGWQQYFYIIQKNEAACSTAGIHCDDVNLIRALLTCKLYFECKRTCGRVEEHIQNLHEILAGVS